MALIHFLLVYDLNKQTLVSQQEFRDGSEAAKAYAQMEARCRDAEDLEIVLVGADSLDTIKMTHGQYFDEAAAVPSQFLSLTT
jgi:hypothetical protein